MCGHENTFENEIDMKKTLLLVCMLLMLAGVRVNAAETVKIGDLYFSISYPNATLLADQSNNKDVYKALESVTIPATFTYDQMTYTVNYIGTSAFEGCSNLRSVTIPSTIKTIAQYAFYQCSKLTEIIIPEGVTSIGKGAFSYTAISTITIPSTVTSMGDKPFYSCQALTSVVWKPVNCSVSSDDAAPFYDAGARITSFKFGDQVETVPACICKNLSKIDTIVLPPSVKALGQNAFKYCTSLKSINLPQTQKTLPVGIFEGCTALESIELPATLTTFSTDVFYGCTKLSNVTLHEGITTIGERAFYNCKLSSVTIPSTVTSIGNGAFKGNPLTSVTWLPVTCSTGSDDAAPFYSTSSQITSFTFGDKVELVPAYICKNMSKLETIVLPPSVSRLGQNAFMYCTSLKSINLPQTQKTLPVGIFEGCTSLESIELPATLTTFSTDVFYGCTKLSNVTLHEGITTIGERAFYNCKLSSVTIPSTVTSIGNGAFKGNPLTSVTWLPVTCSTGTDDSAPFYSTSSQITSFTFGDNVQVVPAYICKNMNKLDTIVLPATVTSVGQSAFMYCSNLKEMVFPKGIKTVATSVLEGCTKLEKVVIPASVTTINQDAFYSCSGLQAIYNYAITPQTITERAVNSVNKQTCILYVPMDYLDLYKAKAVWCDFKNIIGVATDLQFEDQLVQLTYFRKDETPLFMESKTWQIPHAPYIQGFVFEKWEVLAGDLNDGIVLQAVYKEDDGTGAPAAYTNPANPAQKLIRRGNVYVLQDGKTYTVNGTRVE